MNYPNKMSKLRRKQGRKYKTTVFCQDLQGKQRKLNIAYEDILVRPTLNLIQKFTAGGVEKYVKTANFKPDEKLH